MAESYKDTTFDPIGFLTAAHNPLQVRQLSFSACLTMISALIAQFSKTVRTARTLPKFGNIVDHAHLMLVDGCIIFVSQFSAEKWPLPFT